MLSVLFVGLISRWLHNLGMGSRFRGNDVSAANTEG
jgi:hypothetical protein